MKTRLYLIIVTGLLILSIVGNVAAQKRTDFEIHMQAGGVGIVTCGDFDDPPITTDIGGGYLELLCPVVGTGSK